MKTNDPKLPFRSRNENTSFTQSPVRKRLTNLARQKIEPISGYTHINPVLSTIVESIQMQYDQGGSAIAYGIPTGFPSIDRQTRGLHRSELTLIAGPSMSGKSTFALNIAQHIATESKLPVCVLSFGLNQFQVGLRLLVSTGLLDSNRIPFGQLDDDEWCQLSNALGKLNEAPIFINESVEMTSSKIRLMAKRLKRLCPTLGLVVIDPLQLIMDFEHNDNHTGNASELLLSFKTLARELDAPVIVTARVDCTVDKGVESKPTIRDLHASGISEKNADVIILMSRDNESNDEAKIFQDQTELIIDKQLHGPACTVKLAYSKEFLRFESVEEKLYGTYESFFRGNNIR